MDEVVIRLSALEEAGKAAALLANVRAVACSDVRDLVLSVNY